jgi:type VI protein secretion system component Hcp
MAEKSTDMLMMIEKSGQAMAAECSAAIDKTDALMKGFQVGKYFEVDDFDFGISLTDTDASAKGTSPPHNGGVTQPGQPAQKTGARFSKWVQGMGATAYTIEMEPFSFTRQMDIASVGLFYSCFLTKSFDAATLVMRKSGGILDTNTGISNIPFLRIDFSGILIVGIDWDGGEVVKEKCKFVCRRVSVQYRPQLHDGTAGQTVGGDWLALKKTT